jgi:L-ascorbate metabolism protein UlaG (beta-lactamase superfamily)
LELTSSGAAHFDDEGNVYFLGNATTLIRFGGLTILTDHADDSSTTTTQFVYLAHGDT